MIEIRRILCPIDFSEASRHALEHAVLIGRWYRSPVTALHVIQAPALPAPPGFPEYLGRSALPTPDPLVFRKELQRWLEPAQAAGVQTEIVVEEGAVVRRILEEASSRQSDLIVMGTHGLSGIDRFVLGSITEKVLRKATSPVLTLPPAAATEASIPYKRLLCAIDFSDSSLTGLRYASSLAKEADAQLTILNVLDWQPDDDLMVERFDEKEFRRVVESDARARLDDLVTPELQAWCKPATRLASGKPYQRILEVADEERTDLIVMGVRGRKAVDLTVFGSTTNQVVRRASCPVLTLRQ